jgi:hypothetical protein
VAKTTVKRLLCCRFSRIGKAKGQAYQRWWRVCQKINFFSRFKYHMFYILYPFVTYLQTLPHIKIRAELPTLFYPSRFLIYIPYLVKMIHLANVAFRVIILLCWYLPIHNNNLIQNV